MMMISKLKAAGAFALAAVVLTTGLGVGLAPARADDGPGAPPVAAQKAAVRIVAGDARPDDALFLRRVRLDLTGSMPTPLEVAYFVADTDGHKRRKIVDWMLTQEDVRAYLSRGSTPTSGAATFVTVTSFLARAAAGRDPQDGAQKPGVAVVWDGVNQEQPAAWVAEPPPVAGEKPADAQARERKAVILHRRQLYEFTQDSVLRPAPHAADADARWLQYIPSAGTEAWVVDDGDRYTLLASDRDEVFLTKAVEQARGGPPTAIEKKYYLEDTAANKRERLLDLLLADPVVAKRLGAEWKKKMLGPVVVDLRPGEGARPQVRAPLMLSEGALTLKKPEVTIQLRKDVAAPPHEGGPAEALIAGMIASQRTDAQILEVLALAYVGRGPTAEEKRVALALVAKAADRKAAWVTVAKALAPVAPPAAPQVIQPARP